MSTVIPNLYELLGVERDAEAKQIRSAFRKKARLVHPDVNPGMEQMYLMLQHAHDTLTDEKARAEYDRSIGGGARGSQSTGSEPAGASPTGSGVHSTPPPQQESSPCADMWRLPEEAYEGPLPRPLFDLARLPWLADETIAPVTYIRTRTGLLRRILLLFGALAGSFLLAVLLGGTMPALWIGVALISVWVLVRRGLTTLAKPVLLVIAGMVGAAYLDRSILRPVQVGDPGVDWLAAIGLAATAVCLSLPVWAARHLRDRPHLVNISDVDGVFRWGEPGEGLLDAISTFGDQNVRDGIEGERLTEAIIGSLLGRLPGVRMINGLRFPGSRSADVDHAVICGNKVAFIDSKAWAPSSYTMTDRETVVSANGYTRTTHMWTATVRYLQMLRARRRTLGLIHVRGYTLVHAKHDRVPLALAQERPNTLNRIVTAQELVEELGEWMNDGERSTVNLALVSYLLSQRK